MYAVRGLGVAGVLSLVAVAVALAAARPDAPHATAMRYACASDGYGAPGVLHFVRRPSACEGDGRLLIDFRREAPIAVCRKEHGARGSRARAGARRRGPVGLVRLVDERVRCGRRPHPNESVHSLPRRTRTRFCADRRDRSLRWVDSRANCRRTELAVVLATRHGRKRTLAGDDGAATDEDHPVAVEIKANDTPGARGRKLAIVSLDTRRLGGAAALTPGGTLAYDPASKFETLKPGATATDTFRYRVSDGVHVADATVTVRVAGVNDSPRLANVEGDALAVRPGAAGSAVTATIGLADVDDEQMAGAVIRIARGLDTARHDTLGFESREGITGTYNSGTGVLTLTGSAPGDAYERALRSVTFSTDADAPKGERTISFQVDDGHADGNLSNLATRDVHVTSATLSIATQPALTPGFSPDVEDYAVRCASGDPVDVAVDAPAGTQVAVDGQAPRGGDFATAVDLAASQAFSFVVSEGEANTTYHVRCLPEDFPAYEATVLGERQAQWYFVTPSSRSDNRYAAVFDSDGVPVWWTQPQGKPFDFKLLANGNVGFFSFFDGSPQRQFNELKLDGTFVRGTNTVGTDTDTHDYEEVPGGDRYLVSYRPRDHVDVSAYTGKPEDVDAAVLDAEVQRIAPDGSLVWAWNSSTHIALAETGRWWQIPAQAQTPDGRNFYDIVHINSVEDDGDGIVISLRHTDAVYRIDKATGAVDWKLGGTARPESLTIVGDDAHAGEHFGGQHDARILPDGSLTVHENGTGYVRTPRALRFQLDTSAGTATLVERIEDPEANLSICCGSARRLPGGNWVMSWGGGYVTELGPDGSRRLKLVFPGDFSYRAAPVLPGVLSAADLRAGMDAQHPRP